MIGLARILSQLHQIVRSNCEKARKCLTFALIVIAFIVNRVIAEKLEMPSQLAEFSEEAFAGNSSDKEVIIPDGMLAIGDYAFSDCTDLGWISIPTSVESLGEGFENGCADDLFRSMWGEKRRKRLFLHGYLTSYRLNPSMRTSAYISERKCFFPCFYTVFTHVHPGRLPTG